MANFVTKKDGTKVSFDSDKLKNSIAAAATDSGLSNEESQSVAGEILESVMVALEGQEEVTTSEVRNKIISELDEKYPSVSESWRKYEESKG